MRKFVCGVRVNDETSQNLPKLSNMNRNWSAPDWKLVTLTFHSFSISYTLCRNWLSVIWFCISCTQHNRHIPPWSYDLYYFLFSQTEHAQRFFFFFWATNHLSLFISLTLTTWFTPLRFSLFSYANVFFVFVWIQNSLFFFVY